MDPLADAAVIAEIKRAWAESLPDDLASRREEGGYIVVNSDLSYGVERWASGGRFGIVPAPLDATGCYNGKRVIATFHMHPNPPTDENGEEWEQGPSEADRRWHERRKLRGFVVSRMLVYEINERGTISVIGKRVKVLGK